MVTVSPVSLTLTLTLTLAGASAFLAAGSVSAAEPATSEPAPARMTVQAASSDVDSGYSVRVDFPTGLSQAFTTMGIGLYPINSAHSFRGSCLFPFVSLGGTTSVLLAAATDDLSGAPKIAGGLAQGRVVLGVKYRPARTWVISAELGYSPWAVGFTGSDSSLRRYRAASDATSKLPAVEVSTRGGVGTVIDLSVGVEWL